MIPDGWREVALEQVAKIAIGRTPPRKEKSNWDLPKKTENRWATIGDLKSKSIAETTEYISDLGVGQSKSRLVPTGTLLMSFKLSIGKAAITAAPMYTNEAIAAFYPKKSAITEYLYYLLPTLSLDEATDRAVKGRTLNKAKLRALRLVLPSLPEQRKIADILSSVDDAIEKSQAVIDQVQIVKRGLMQELFSRGLPGQHTIFHETEIGELPKVWAVETVGSVAASGRYSCVGGPFGSDLTRRDYVDSPGVPVIRGSNLDASSAWLKEDSFVFVSDTKAVSLQRNTASPGDLIFTQRGTLGQVCRIPTQSRFKRYVISQSQMKITVDAKRMNADFLLAYFRSPQAQKLIERMTIGTGVPHLNLGILKAFPVPLPSLEEQSAIADYLSSTDARVDSELRFLKALKDLRSGLLSTLLTGAARVMPVTEAA